MKQINYLQLMAQVKREGSTETKVRAMDAHDVVEWIHRLEDEIEALEARSSPAPLIALAERLQNFDSSGGLSKETLAWLQNEAQAALAKAEPNPS